jgi:hypothetical protein
MMTVLIRFVVASECRLARHLARDLSIKSAAATNRYLKIRISDGSRLTAQTAICRTYGYIHGEYFLSQ